MNDPTIQALIAKEKKRQEETLALIPSENYTSVDVREAVGSVLMNKYSEGQVGKRYYQGNENIDEIEKICKDRAIKFFHVNPLEWEVNVQALSGSPANLAVYSALVPPGETIMSMYLPDGGHLSHGWNMKENKITLVSKIWNVVFYHVEEDTKVFDYDKLERQVKEVKPKLLISGGTAYPREINHERMAEIAHSVGGIYMADIAHEAGLVGAQVNQSPFPFADVVTMTTHKTLRGPRGALIFSKSSLSPLIDKAVFPGLQGGPHNHTIAGIAVALGEALAPTFHEYAKQVIANAATLAELFTGVGFDVVSGGTDKHLILLDLRKTGVSGWVAAWALEYAGIVANRNTIPYETASPFFPSGLRLGTPAITTRGMKEPEMEKIGKWVIDVIVHSKKWKLPAGKEQRKPFIHRFMNEVKTDPYLMKIRKEVKEFCLQFPTP